jgi:predicted GH43/DUF377 family glycosyl hydrolase
MRAQVLVRPEDLSPSSGDFEVIGAFNPGAVQTADGIVLLVRVAQRPRELRPGYTGLPRWHAERGVAIDWVPDGELEWLDPRVARRTTTGLVRLPFISHLRAIRLRDGTTVEDFRGTTFAPEDALQEYGVEDPRITPLDGRYFLTYFVV